MVTTQNMEFKWISVSIIREFLHFYISAYCWQSSDGCMEFKIPLPKNLAIYLLLSLYKWIMIFWKKSVAAIWPQIFLICGCHLATTYYEVLYLQCACSTFTEVYLHMIHMLLLVRNGGTLSYNVLFLVYKLMVLWLIFS